MANPSNPQYHDGDFSTAVRISRTPCEYPFRQNGDLATKIYDAVYVVSIDSFAPTAIGTVDPELAGHYLLAESRPEIFQGKLCTFRRTYGNIPAEQSVPTSVSLSKPDLSGSFPLVFGSYRITQPDASLSRYDIYRAIAVTADGGAPSFYPSGGTYTLTFGGATTGALNHSDSAGTVQTALNALTPVSNRGSVTVGGTYNDPGGLTIAFSGYAQITLGIGSLTGGTILKSESLQNVGATQTLRAWRSAAGSAPTALNTSAVTHNSTVPLATYLDYTDSARPRINNAYRIRFGAQNGTISGGTFTVSVAGITTAAIAVGTNAAMKAALQAALDTALGAGVIAVGYWPDEESYYGTAAMDAFNFNGALTGGPGFLLTFTEGGATGGTFTITVGADTTSAIAYNATAATISTALNALASVTSRGGCTVSGDLAAGISVAFLYGNFTATSSLTPSGSTVTPSNTDGGVGRTHKVVFASATATRDLYALNHGIAAGGQLLLRTAGSYYYPVLNYLVLDANTIRLQVSAADAWAAIGTITELGVLNKALYAPGLATCRAKRITSFYLPGVTSGIATADDVPIPASSSEAELLKLAIFAGSGTLNWQVGELVQYRDSAILSLTRTVINAADL